ncbi:MAG: hypothetical protein J6B37_06605 [Clostridia bacterium]|nr:hypothetical protein [Clostridia bacterium]
MDDNFYTRKRERKATSKRINEKQSFLTKVIITQLVMSLLLTGLLYGVCRTESNLSQNIKSFYAEISKNDIAVSSLFDTFKNVVKQTFSPSVEQEENTENIAGEEVSFSPVFTLV